AVQSVREAARRSQCQDHLHNLALAMHSYEGSFRCLPPAYVDLRGSGQAVDDQPHWAWSAMILPNVEQKPLSDNLNVSGWPPIRALDGRLRPFETPIALFTCPSSSQEELHNPSIGAGYCVDNTAMANTGVAIANYVVSNNTKYV